MLVVFAGLPGSGKSTLATAVAAAVDGVVLNKDAVRAALFPPPVLDYSPEPDDMSMEAIYSAVGWILRHRPEVPVLIDGRTFSRRRHVDRLIAVAAGFGISPVWVECVCPDVVAEGRLRADPGHPAKNRNAELLRRKRATTEPLLVDRLVLDTSVVPIDECVRRVRAFAKL